MRRRDMLGFCATVLGGSLSSACTSAVNSAVAVSTPTATGNTRERAVASLVEVIVPRTDTPGAIDAGVPAFVEALLDDWYDARERAAFLGGLDWLDRAAQEAGAGDFASADGPLQQALVADLMTGAEDQQAFFRQAREAAVVGFFTSPIGASQVLTFDPIPGRYEGAVRLETLS